MLNFRRTIRPATVLLLVSAPIAMAGGLEVSLTDGDPYDRIYISNTGACDIVAGALTLDFAGSDGKIVIDTAYGGVGTKDPMPVEVETGNIAVAPVADGDTEISVLIHSLGPGGTAIVTLDFDNNASFWFMRRVAILADDVVGTVARFEAPGVSHAANFANGGSVQLDLPEAACSAPENEPTTAPIS